jgi:poly-gamma-glutamate synthesis protein (capsule biosynthesis protein)
MKFLLLLALPALLFAGYKASIHPIDKTIEKRMRSGHSYRKGCPVPLRDLRYLRMTYRGFDGHDHTGEMIVHRNVAKEVTQIFGKLYQSKYPIRKMVLVSRYNASDFQSIEADNTSAFNCRPITGGTKWSRHSYGKAIDINPIENPYISRSGHIAHKKSLRYGLRGRKHRTNKVEDKAIMPPGDPIVYYFKSHGWRGGGDWRSIKDYQHFDKPGRTTRRKPKPAKHKTRVQDLFKSLDSH